MLSRGFSQPSFASLFVTVAATIVPSFLPVCDGSQTSHPKMQFLPTLDSLSATHEATIVDEGRCSITKNPSAKTFSNVLQLPKLVISGYRRYFHKFHRLPYHAELVSVFTNIVVICWPAG